MADYCLMGLDSSSSTTTTTTPSLWAYNSLSSSFPETLWNNITAENDALTKALSAAADSSSPSPSASASGSFITVPETRPALSSRNPLPCSAASAKISKRKSRASKKSPTTYITADPANFRQMVQQVTGGVGFGADASSLTPVICRPEPQRGSARPIIGGGGGGLGVGCLPTLDTSAFFLDRARIVAGSVGQPVSGFDYGFSSFPTLESWTTPM